MQLKIAVRFFYRSSRLISRGVSICFNVISYMREVSPFFIQSMIQSRSLKSFFALREENSSEGFMNVLVFLGQPIVAVGLGLIVAILTLGRSLDRREALTEMEKGMASAGIIMLVTGGGGALG